MESGLQHLERAQQRRGLARHGRRPLGSGRVLEVYQIESQAELQKRPNSKGNVDADANGRPNYRPRADRHQHLVLPPERLGSSSLRLVPELSGDQAAAYTALNNYLGLDNGTVRDVYTDPTRTPTGDELSGYETSIAARCTGQTTDFPPTFTTCNPPGSGITLADWTAVSNQIMAELYWARQVINHFTTLNALNTSLFINQNSEFPSITDDLKLPAAGDNAGSADYFNLGANLVESLFNLGGAVFPELGITADAIGVFLSATAFYSSNSDPDGYQVQHAFAQMQQQVTTSSSRAPRRSSRSVPTSPATTGCSPGGPARRVEGLDAGRGRGAQRQPPAVHLLVYQTLLPAVWDKLSSPTASTSPEHVSTPPAEVISSPRRRP